MGPLGLNIGVGYWACAGEGAVLLFSHLTLWLEAWLPSLCGLWSPVVYLLWPVLSHALD